MARGKYAGVIDSLPKFQGTEPDYQARVNNRKAELIDQIREETGMPPGAAGLTRIYAELRRRKDELEALESAVNLEIEAVTQMLVDQLENEGVSTLRVDTGDAVRVQYEPYAQVQDRDKAREWAIQEGLERSLMLPWQTLNALVKKRLLAGQSEPPGVVAFNKAKIVYTKG